MTEQAEEIRALVREKYGAIARNEGSCCDSSCHGEAGGIDMIGNTYQSVEGYFAEADLGLGCGLPSEHAGIRIGDTVLDLGAGAGIDAFVARRLAGEEGQVYGVDMTPDMVAKARANTEKLGYRNVEFRLGEIEHLPFERDSIDVVISNCVLNLVPNKARVFTEVFRVLRPGARFCISDILASAPLPESLRKAAALYIGCVAGAEPEANYLAIVKNSGFRDIYVVKSRRIGLPEDILASILSVKEIAAMRDEDLHIKSVTVVGTKPLS
ncbi:MAG: arsenite methyltransferase [Rhizobiales bacterium]|nr:arsenite methyltransferase [Hyphomicrobiales bacterium]